MTLTLFGREMKYSVYAGHFGESDWHEWVATIAGLTVTVAGAEKFHFALTEDVCVTGFDTPGLARDAAEATLRKLRDTLNEAI
jgi:hypothetical protein